MLNFAMEMEERGMKIQIKNTSNFKLYFDKLGFDIVRAMFWPRI